MSNRRVFRLADFDQDLGSVELASGKVVPIKAIDGVAVQLREQIKNGGDASLVWDILERVLPDAGREEVLKINSNQARRIIEISAGLTDEIVSELGNATGETATPASAPPATS